MQIPLGAMDFNHLLNLPDQFGDPPSLVFIGYQGSFLEVKQLELQVIHSPDSCVEVKNYKVAIIYHQHN